MSEEKQRTPIDRKKRVQFLKKIIISLLVLFILTPCVLCVALFIRVNSLNRDIEALSGQLAQLKENWDIQAAQMAALSDKLSSSEGQNIAVTQVTGGDGFNEILQGEKSTEEITGVMEEPKEEYLHKVYLTFDDGPSMYTDDILDILDRYDVKATFFVVGKESESAKEAMCRIVEEGHTLGMHSYSHKYREIYQSVEDFSADFIKLKEYLYEVTGVESRFYRFPGGSSNDVSDLDMKVFGEYLKEQGIVFFDWNASSGDGGAKLLSVDALTENSLTGITNRETTVILLHDSANKRTTVEALPIIIENILALEDTVILPITEDTEPVQHIQMN